MRIISKFHDYYDIGLAYGQDDELVYVRERQEIGEEDRTPWDYASRNDPVSCSWRNWEIGFCGTIYPITEIDTHQSNARNVHHWAHSAAEFTRITQQQHAIGWRWRRGEDDYFEPYREERLFIEHKVPIWARVNRSRRLILNPRLHDFDFFRVVDPYTAFQEISMYLGGVLGGTGNPMAQVADEHRYAGHGFDKESFRMPKGRKKPRRKG